MAPPRKSFEDKTKSRRILTTNSVKNPQTQLAAVVSANTPRSRSSTAWVHLQLQSQNNEISMNIEDTITKREHLKQASSPQHYSNGYTQVQYKNESSVNVEDTVIWSVHHKHPPRHTLTVPSAVAFYEGYYHQQDEEQTHDVSCIRPPLQLPEIRFQRRPCVYRACPLFVGR